MLDQMLESFRKASESSLNMQSDMFKQWVQQWPTMPLNAAGVSSEWVRTFQKRWIEFLTDSLNKNRASVDSAYGSGIKVIEQTFRLSEAKTPEEYRHLVEDLWRKMFDVLKDQSETQLRDFQKGFEKLLETIPKAKV
jgi:hypothetical protein